MISTSNLGLLVFCYVVFILAVGLVAEFIHKKWPRWVDNSIVYSFSLGVFCTAWTLFGSIQLATTSGMLFFAVFLGPVLGSIFWWPLLRKLIRIKNRFRITSIADFISARYNKLTGIGALSTVLILIGFVPYIALQISSMIRNTELLLRDPKTSNVLTANDSFELLLVAGIILITILFGLRRVISTDRNPAMTTTLAVESLFKLTAALVGGGFIVYFLNDGVLQSLEMLPKVVSDNYSFMGTTSPSQFVTWISYIVFSMFAVLFLPRQFHVAVIENSNENHVKTAKWLFPLFLLLINLFVLPIAVYGLKARLPVSMADTYFLRLPLMANNMPVALLIYFGGLSASLGMITAETAALSTMVTNQILAPIIVQYPVLYRLKRHFLKIRWVVAILLIMTGYYYQRALGSDTALISIGIISFLASMQFVPSILAGLYWEKVSSKGVYIAISVGFALWLYTAFIPTLAKDEILFSSDFIKYGLFRISWLRPEALFGLEGLSAISHSFLWCTFANVFGLVLGSKAFPATKSELAYARDFLYDEAEEEALTGLSMNRNQSSAMVLLAPKIVQAKELFELYFDPKTSLTLLNEISKKLHFLEPEQITIGELADLQFEIEVYLSGAIGAAAAHRSIQNHMLISKEEQKQLTEFIAATISDLGLSPRELRKKIDYHQEKETLLLKNTQELLAAKVAADAANLAKSAFLANMSHEIRTPLGAVLGFTDLIIDPQVQPSEKANFAAVIKRNGELLSNIINDILDLSKIESGKMQITTLNVLLAEVLTDTKTMLELQAKSKGIALGIAIDESVPDIIRTDPLRLRQVLINIIGNAIKFTSKGAVDVKVQRQSSKNGQDLLAFIVKDTGCGIREDQIIKLFVPFSQADDTSKRTFGGTGLGLVLSRRFANLLGGDVVLAQTSPDEGSTFTITIDPGPIHQIHPAETRAAKLIAFQGSRPRLEGIKILLAEDSPDNQFLVSRILKLAGATVEIASNGAEAVEMAQQDHYKVVLMDLQMPVMDGYEATAELRKKGYHGKIIALTAHTLDDDRKRCFEGGFDDHIGKPINRNILIEKMVAY